MDDKSLTGRYLRWFTTLKPLSAFMCVIVVEKRKNCKKKRATISIYEIVARLKCRRSLKYQRTLTVLVIAVSVSVPSRQQEQRTIPFFPQTMRRRQPCRVCPRQHRGLALSI